MRHRRRASGMVGIVLRGCLILCVMLGALFAALLILDTIAPPVSTLMMARLVEGHSYQRDYVPLSRIAPIAIATIVASEDARFCHNDGVDWGSLKEVLDEPDGPTRGASTITMQTAKNLFLWPVRTSLRKGVEIAIALVLGKVWSKAHTLDVYLNIAEWGEGIFGIEAAARHYFGKSARQLNATEAALLATALPNPVERDAAAPAPFQRRLAANLMARARDSSEWLDCLPRRERPGR